MQRSFSPKRIAGLAGMVLVAGFLVLRGSGEEARIRKQLNALDQAIDLNGEEALLESVSAANDIAAFFTEDAFIDAGHPLDRVSNRREFKGLITQTRQRAKQLKVTIHGMEVIMGEEPRTALVELMLEGKIDVLGEQASEFREYDLHLRKEGGDWLIAKVKHAVSITDPSQGR